MSSLFVENNCCLLVAVYILAKNEEANIAKCLESLIQTNWPVFVLDSGSTDRTVEIARAFPSCNVISHSYTNHCDSYNQIISDFALNYDYVVVLDADMEVTQSLIGEIMIIMNRNYNDKESRAIYTPVEMWASGKRLRFASLCPAKAIVFTTGVPLFESIGHGERLIDDVKTSCTTAKLIHNDLKAYSSYLLSQDRYSRNLYMRGLEGKSNWKDRCRIKTPIFLFITPIVSFVFKLGFLDGRVGLIYALDRLIAEAIMFRNALASRIDRLK